MMRQVEPQYTDPLRTWAFESQRSRTTLFRSQSVLTQKQIVYDLLKGLPLATTIWLLCTPVIYYLNFERSSFYWHAAHVCSQSSEQENAS